MEYGISVKVNGVGEMDFRDGYDLHETKSRAGIMFHDGLVESVCVYDEKGTSHLYLRKDSEGKCIKREELT